MEFDIGKVERSQKFITDFIMEQGPFDGIMGFSQVGLVGSHGNHFTFRLQCIACNCCSEI